MTSALERETAPVAARRSSGIDLMQCAPLRSCVRWRGFPYVFQALLLASFVGLTIVAWGRRAPSGVDAKSFAKSNLATLLVWGLWWPSMVWAAVLVGRVWCQVCPLELVGNLSERLARLTGSRPRKLGRRLRSGALIVALYALIQMLVAGVQLHRVPAYTAWFLATLLAAAAVVSFAFADRAFCRGACPVGLLLAVYGRGGVLSVRARSEDVCHACAERECTAAALRTRADARSCPSLLRPPRLDRRSDCLLCGQCVKVCRSHNMGFVVHPPFDRAGERCESASWPVTLFVMLVSGFVAREVASELPAAERALLALPRAFAARTGLEIHVGWLEGVWTILALPIVAWSLLALLARSCGDRDSVAAIWRRLALPLAVVVSAGHMAKGLAKLASWGPYLPGALRDPAGTETASAVSAGLQAAPEPWLGRTAVAATGVALVALASAAAWRETRGRSGVPGESTAIRAPIAAVAMACAAVVAGWARV